MKTLQFREALRDCSFGESNGEVGTLRKYFYTLKFCDNLW